MWWRRNDRSDSCHTPNYQLHQVDSEKKNGSPSLSIVIASRLVLLPLAALSLVKNL